MFIFSLRKKSSFRSNLCWLAPGTAPLTIDKDPIDPGLCGSGAVVNIVSHTNKVQGLIPCWLHFVWSSYCSIVCWLGFYLTVWTWANVCVNKGIKILHLCVNIGHIVLLRCIPLLFLWLLSSFSHHSLLSLYGSWIFNNSELPRPSTIMMGKSDN